MWQGHRLPQATRAARPRPGSRAPLSVLQTTAGQGQAPTASREKVGPDPRETGSGGNVGRPRTCYILHGLCSPIAGWMAGLGGAGLLLLRPYWKPGPCWRLCFFRDKETEVQKIGDLRPLRLENDRTGTRARTVGLSQARRSRKRRGSFRISPCPGFQIHTRGVSCSPASFLPGPVTLGAVPGPASQRCSRG